MTSEPNSVLNRLALVLTFSPAAKALPDFCFGALACLSVGLFCLFLGDLAFGEGRPWLRRLNWAYELMPAYLPPCVWLSTVLYAESQMERANFCGVLAVLLGVGWCAYTVLLQPTCLQPHRCLDRWRELAFIGAFMAACFSQVAPKAQSLAALVLLQSVLLGWHLLSVGFVSERVERVRIVGLIAGTLLALVELIEQLRAPDLVEGETVLMLLVLALIACRLEFVEILMELRCAVLFSREAKDLETSQIISVVYCLSEKDSTWDLPASKKMLPIALELGLEPQSIIAYAEESKYILTQSSAPRRRWS